MNLKQVWYVGILFSLVCSAAYAVDAAAPVESGSTSSPGGFPAHYFVFDRRSDGTIVPVSYQPVRLAAPLASLSTGRLAQSLGQPSRNATPLVVLLQDTYGNTLYRDLVSYSTWLRGEFQSASGADGIDGHFIQQENTAFVLRLPVMQAARLVLQDSQLNTLASFDLAGLIATTPGPQITTAQVVVQGTLTGSPANRIDLVVLGDGYTAEQAADFQADAQLVMSQFFSISPLTEYSNYYNLYTLEIESKEAGADHPEYKEACSYSSPRCCGDPEMLEDPLQGQMVDTAFDSRYCAYWIHRLLVSNYSKVYEAAGAVPDWDQLLLLVNDDTYGGSGATALAIVSTHEMAVSIAQHEYGHSFGNLADEYDSPYPGFATCSDAPESTAPCEANVTDISERSQLKWLPWIEDSTPIPTPEELTYDGLVGLFEGARYLETGMYRSGYRCLMKALNSPYCQIPSQEIVLTIYRGGWGTPVDGIRLIEPGSTLPITTTLSLDYLDSVTFSAEILSPIGGPAVEITWLEDNVPIPGATGNSFTYTVPLNSPGLHTITLRVKDITPLVHPLMAGDQLVEEYSWQVEVLAPLDLDYVLLPLLVR